MSRGNRGNPVHFWCGRYRLLCQRGTGTACPAGRTAQAMAGHRGDRDGLVDRRRIGVHGARPARMAALHDRGSGRRGARHVDSAVATPRRAPRIARSPERAQLNSNQENTMAAPLLQAQIDINAPVGKVWELVSDLSG